MAVYITNLLPDLRVDEIYRAVQQVWCDERERGGRTEGKDVRDGELDVLILFLKEESGDSLRACVW